MSVQPKKGHPALRRTMAIVVSILLVLVAVFASAGLWVRTEVLNSGAMGSDARVFLADAAVAAKVGEFLTDTAVDVGKEVKKNSKDGSLGRVLAQSLTEKKIAPYAEAIAVSEPVVDTIAALVETAHREVLEILKGNAAQGTTVSLNLVPVVVSVLQEMQTQKIFPESVTLPVLADSSTPAADVAAFEKAFKINLKDDFGQLQIVKDDSIQPDGGTSTGGGNGGPDGATIKDEGGLKFSDIDGKLASASKALNGVFVLLILLGVAVTFIAPSRKSGVRIVTVSLLIASVMASVIARTGPSRIADQMDNPVTAKIVAAILDSIVSSYVTLSTIMLILSILAVLASFWGQKLTRRTSGGSAT